MRSTRSAGSLNMTEGPIWKQLLLFALPLMVGNVFQQFYNTVDAIIVGNYVSKQALAAVGTTGNVINAVISLAIGLSTGASVAISQYFGARDRDRLHTAVHTTVAMTLTLGLLLTALAVPLVPLMIRAMRTPLDVQKDAATYLRIYFSGLVGLLLYNAGAAILRAVGDSKRPLYFLIASTILNAVFDYIFVVGFGLGIRGVAFATILTQALSAVLTLYVLSRSHGDYRIVWRHVRLDRPMLRIILKLGLPTAAQQVVTSFSNVFVQGYINGFGTDTTAGWTTYAKVDAFALLPIQSLSLASTTFVGQNVGAGKMDRAKKGVSVSMKVTLSVTAVLIVALNLLAEPLVRLFTQEAAVVENGLLFVRFMSPFYFLCCVNQILAGALRGAGDTKAPMYIMLGSFVLFRQIYLAVTSWLSGAKMWVALAYPAGWIVCSAILVVYYFRADWTKKRVT